jgi:2,3-dihydroxybiphenyl 1,2-dioxygenase
MINALEYLVVRTRDLPGWRQLATELAGLQADDLEPGRSMRLRMDQNMQRFLIEAHEGAPSLTFGYGVERPEMLGVLRNRLERLGIEVTDGTLGELASRGVQHMLHFRDPDGYRVEVAADFAQAASPFAGGRPTGGFRTGHLGMGHAALSCGRFDDMCRFYRDVLGFQLSDAAAKPFRVDFLHVNPRHHTLGLADLGSSASVYHIMLEYNEFDDLGRAYDLALEHPESIGVSLGRHLNDNMTSFYVRTPDGWLLELGWAGRLIDASWQVCGDLPGLSLWGHDRTWLPPDRREAARELLRELSGRGLRSPVVPAAQAAKSTY